MVNSLSSARYEHINYLPSGRKSPRWASRSQLRVFRIASQVIGVRITVDVTNRTKR